jgi:integrase
MAAKRVDCRCADHRYRRPHSATPRLGGLLNYYNPQPEPESSRATVLYGHHNLMIERGLLQRMPLFPKRLEENPPRDGFFEHDEYLKVRAQAPASYQDVLDFAYYSGWRRNEILHLTWAEVDLSGGVIRLSLRRSKTRTGRVLPISAPLRVVLERRVPFCPMAQPRR